jgi:hypothetical protein
VLIDEKALEESGVESGKASITVRGQALPLVGIFDHVLDQQQLAWRVRHGAIVITTHEENERSGLELQVYPVADLLDTTPRHVDELDDLVETEPLVDLIVTTVAPDSWDEVGGPGSIRLLPERSVLVISQMREVHESIERLLTALRAAPLASPIASPTSALQPTHARGSRAIGAPAQGTSRAGTNDSPVRTFRRMTSTPRWLLPRSHE